VSQVSWDWSSWKVSCWVRSLAWRRMSSGGRGSERGLVVGEGEDVRFHCWKRVAC